MTLQEAMLGYSYGNPTFEELIALKNELAGEKTFFCYSCKTYRPEGLLNKTFTDGKCLCDFCWEKGQ